MEFLLLLGFFFLIGFFGRLFCRPRPDQGVRNTYYGDPNVHLRPEDPQTERNGSIW